jgi:iron complex outermembrane receptor protein
MYNEEETMKKLFHNSAGTASRRPNLKIIIPAIVLTASTFATTPAPVYAQSGVLEEVIVTARYREENLQETPLAITALSSADLDVRAMSASYEIAYSIPNASFRRVQGAFGNTMSAYIRGIGQNDFNFAFEPGVGIYIDDVYFPTTMGSVMDLMDLERVEVLRGPQGTLFGRGSIGGAMRMVSKKPQGDDTGMIQVTGGRFGRIDLRASYDFAITENLFARVAGMSKSRDGYQNRVDFACQHPNAAGNLQPRKVNRNNDCILGTNGGEDVQGGRGSLRWVPAEDIDITLSADYTNDDSEAPANTLLSANVLFPYTVYNTQIANGIYGVNYDSRFVPSDPFVSYATFDDPLVGMNFTPESTMKSWGVSGKAIWNFAPDMGIEAIISHREYDGKFSNDHDVSPLNIQMVDGIQEVESFTAEARFNGTAFNDRLDYTLGYFHFDGHVVSSQTVSFPGLTTFIFAAFAPYPTVGNGVLVNGNDIWDTGSDAFFGHAVYDVTEQLALSVGFRWSDDSKAAQFDNSIVQATLDSSEDRWDYKFGLDYQLTDDIMLYASTATGYRPQAVNPRPFQVTQFLPVDGEEAESYDFGIKGDFFDSRVRLNVAGFYIDYSQRIVPQGGTECTLIPGTTTYDTVAPGTPDAVTDSLGNTCLATTSLTRYVNEPGEILGVEIEGQWNPTDALTLSGVFGLIDWSSDDVINPISNAPVYVPEINWSASAFYEFNMNNGSTLTPRFDVIGQTDICTNSNTAASCSDGYELVNFRLEWASPGRDWTAAVGVTNLTDETYFLNKFDLQAFGQPTLEGQPGRPQEWYLTVRRNF